MNGRLLVLLFIFQALSAYGKPDMRVTTNRLDLNRGGAVGIYNTDLTRERMPFLFSCDHSGFVLEPPGWGAWTGERWVDYKTWKVFTNPAPNTVHYGEIYYVLVWPNRYNPPPEGFTRAKLTIVRLDDPRNLFPSSIASLSPTQTSVVDVVYWRPRIVTMDDVQATTTGSWVRASSSYAWTNYHLHDGNANKGTKSVAFSTSLPVGKYTVSTWYYPYANRATNVPYLIEHASGVSTVIVDQTKGTKGKWMSLGSFNFGSRGSVIVKNSTSNGFVIADAIQWVEEYPSIPSVGNLRID